MSLMTKLAAAVVALGLAKSVEGCCSTVALPRYELKAVETQKASADEVAKSNYARALGNVPEKTSAELVAEMQKEFEKRTAGAVTSTSDVLTLRAALQRSAKAAGINVESAVGAQNSKINESITNDLRNTSIKDANIGQVLAMVTGYSAAAPDLVTAAASPDFSQASITIGKEIYLLSAEKGKLTANAAVTTTALTEPNFDLAKTHRVVTEGAETGKFVTPTSDVVSYLLGKDTMSTELVKHLNATNIKTALDDSVEFFSGKYSPEEKSRHFVAVNGRVYALSSDVERKAFYEAQKAQALEDAKKGGFARVRALTYAELGGKPLFTPEEYDAFAGKALEWLETEDGMKVKVDLGAIAMKPTGNGTYEQVSGGLRRDSLDKQPYFVLAPVVKAERIPRTAAVELLSEMTAKKEYVCNSVGLEAKTTVIDDYRCDALFNAGDVRSAVTGEVIRAPEQMSTTLSPADMSVYGGSFTIYGRARRE